MILYKYYGFNSGLAALRSQKLGFREPRYFNDPFELSYLDNADDQNFISGKISELKKSLVILSLTRTPHNPLMWTHYCEDHKGFVIGYDVDDDFFLSDKYNIISANNGALEYTSEKERIELSPEIKDALHSIYLRSQGESGNTYSPDKLKVINSLLRKSLLYKHECWSYEEEIRVVKVLNSMFEETHVWQSDPNRSYSSLSKLVASRVGVITVPGLYFFNKKARIKEVYLGMRNPLMNRTDNDKIKDDELHKLSDTLSWSVKKISMASSSWGLESSEVERNTLAITEKTTGLLNSFNFCGAEAKYLTEILPLHLGSIEDQYELTNWSGEIKIKKNDRFIA